MITYYGVLSDGTIGPSTEDESTAQELGLTLTTEREIVYGWDGKRYFADEAPARPVTFADYDAAMEEHLDAEKAARGYTKREPSEYAGSSNERWAQDAADWIAHRDSVMEYGLEVQNAAAAGSPVPTLEEFKAALPKIRWTINLALITILAAFVPCISSAEVVKMTPLPTFVAGTNATLAAANARSDENVVRSTNLAIRAANAYTDAAIVEAGAVTPEIAADISRTQTSNVVTKGYVSGLGLSSSDVGAVPTTRKINGQTLDQDITIASGVTSVNSKTGAVTLSASDVGAATPAYVDSQNQVTRAIVESWEGFLDGSNVVFSITNYISGTYNLNSAKLKILEMTNGVYREVYNSRDEILLHVNSFKNNDFRVATNAIVAGVDAKIADKADRAWGQYTSAGGVAPSHTVYMTAPSTIFAGGLEYERVAVGEGMVGILTTKGAPTYTTGDEGTFKFQDDGGTNFFGFAKTDSYVIGCNTDGISVQNHIVTLTYNVTMSGVPCIWYCPTLDVQPLVWEQLNTPDGQPIAGASHTVTWEASPAAGTEVCYLNCPEAKGFFKATVEVAGSAKFMTNMPADLGGGIICSNTVNGVNGVIRPTFNGSSVNWSWSAQ